MEFIAPHNLSFPLSRIRQALLRRSIVRNFSCFGISVALVFLALEIWQHIFSLSEAVTGIVAGSALGALVIFFLLRHFLLIARQPKLAQLALEVEKARPEMMDAFICAVELEGRADAEELLPLERELMQEMQSRHANDQQLYQAVFQSSLSWFRPVTYLLTAGILLILAIRGTVPAKTTYFFRDLLTGHNSGITLTVPANEVPKGSDARLLAVIHRWQQQAEIIYLDPADGKQRRLPMVSTADGSFAFTFYDLAESVRFRVLSPSLRTSWQTLPVYDPPAIESVELTVTAMSYTGRENQRSEMFSDLELIDGEKLTIILTTHLTSKAELKTLGDSKSAPATTFSPMADGRWRLTLQPKHSASLQIWLEDEAGHRVETQPFQVTVSPDLPPVVELLSPEQDSKLKVGDATRLNVFAGDDFGVKSLLLQFSINGDERQQQTLWQADDKERHPEVEYNQLWDLPALQLAEGDLITAQVIALDNRAPESQASRSELFFIVIQPELESMEADGDGNQEKQLDISDLLAESKRLLRLTWDVLALSDAPRARAAADLTRGVKELELEIRRRYHTIQEEAQGQLAEPLPTLFNDCSLELTEAVALLERELIEESIKPQEKCLAALVKIETELMRNAMKSKKSQEGEGESEQGEQEQQQQQDASSQAEQARQQLEKMRALLEQLRRLVPRQEGINEQVAQPGAILPALATRQKQLETETTEVREQLTPIADAARAAATIKNAEQEMHRAGSTMHELDARSGGIHGARARLQLLAAIRQLEDAIRKASANAIAQLADQAAQLSEAQRQAATESEQAAQSEQKPDGATPRQQQEKLQQLTNSLQERMQQTAEQLQDDFPEAAQALREAGKQARDRGLPESQQRAMNALLYKRFDRAAKEQTDAANFLQALANDLHEAGGKMPPMSEEDLRDALQKLQEWAAQANAAGKDQNQSRAQRKLEQIRQDATPTLQEFANALQNQNLQQVADDMSLPTGQESPSQAGELMARQFKMAAAVLEQMLMQMTAHRKIRLHREIVTPPEKYRRQVEEYFKGLGQE